MNFGYHKLYIGGKLVDADNKQREAVTCPAGKVIAEVAKASSVDAEKALDAAQPDVCAAGGITEFKRIANMANTFGVEIVPHSWGTGIALHAAMHLISNLDSIPGRMYDLIPWMELDRTENALRDELTEPLIVPENGLIKVPDKPGLGVDVNDELLEKYKID
ncbi:MAG: hypothetical protein GQ525_04480 [Draconibacterium sp.]|nr:hypothetical protein [Draconibacterium sp.]